MGDRLPPLLTLLLYSVISIETVGVSDQVIAASKDPPNILGCHGSSRVGAIAALLLTGSIVPIGSGSSVSLAALAQSRLPERYQYPAHGGAKPDSGILDIGTTATKRRRVDWLHWFPHR